MSTKKNQSPSRKVFSPWLAALLVLVAGISAVYMMSRQGWFGDSPVQRREFPPFLVAKPAITFADFSGSETCRECHAEIYRKWAASTHGRAGGEPGTMALLGRFDGRPRRFRDGVMVPEIDKKGTPQFRVRQDGFGERVFPVDAMVGGGHMFGGGTQTYFSRFPDGTLRFLPFDFIRDEKVWFGETKDRGWIPIDENLSMTELSEWPPSRVLGTTPDFLNCQECHGSQIQTRFDPARKKYDSRYKTLRINCESCHGPAKKHVEQMRSQPGQSADIGLQPLAVFDKDASLDVCFRCHALKDALQPGYLPGRGLKEYYALKFPMLGANPWHPDGRIKAFGYQQNHLFSDCYINGSMTCVDCHDPHAQDYRDISGNRLQGKFDDGQCLDCHVSKAENPQQHTLHKPGSAGSECTACHMPFLQHKAMGEKLRFARSDHTISIPRPALDARFGLKGACRQCHEDRSPEELQQQVEEGWGPLKPLKPETQALLQALEPGSDPAVLLDALDPHSKFTAGQAALLARLVSMLHPARSVDERVVPALRAFLGHDDLDIRAMALAGLHILSDEDVALHNLLIETLGKAGEKQAALRKRWALVLGFRAEQVQQKGELGVAAGLLLKALQVWPEHAASLQNLAKIYEQGGDLNSALRLYQRVLARNEHDAGVWVNLGVVYRKLGQETEAEQAWLRAVDINPHNKLALFNLGNVAWRRKDYRAAADYYQRAVQEDPALAAGQFALARAYLMLKEYRKARDAVRASLRYDPGHENARRMLADLERVLR